MFTKNQLHCNNFEVYFFRKNGKFYYFCWMGNIKSVFEIFQNCNFETLEVFFIRFYSNLCSYNKTNLVTKYFVTFNLNYKETILLSNIMRFHFIVLFSSSNPWKFDVNIKVFVNFYFIELMSQCFVHTLSNSYIMLMVLLKIDFTRQDIL